VGSLATDARSARRSRADFCEARRLVGARLREERLNRRLTLRELGSRVGVTAAAICEFELGKSWPKVETLCLIVSELELSLDALFRDVLTPPCRNDR
jgi:transcriptional regulator with XRE-family HTH domain